MLEISREVALPQVDDGVVGERVGRAIAEEEVGHLLRLLNLGGSRVARGGVCRIACGRYRGEQFGKNGTPPTVGPAA